MTVLRGIAAGLVLSALAGQGFAQSAPEAPTIQIAPSSPSGLPEGAQPNLIQPPLVRLPPVQTPPVQVPQAKTTAPFNGVPAESPSINIATPAGVLPSAELAATPVVPLPRDASQTATDAATVEDWRLVLVPVDEFIPTDVRIGGSMPTPGHFRLSGEVASADFVLTLPNGIPPPANLVLSLRSSVNVLPRNSNLTVWVNGTEAGSVPLDSFGEFADKSVPVTGLVPGENRIRLTTVQSHRIFCGPEASFAIWTEVNLGQSGVSVSPVSMPVTAQGFVAVLNTQVASGRPIEFLTDAKTDAALVRGVANRVTAAIGGASQIKVQSFYDVQSGPETHARIALIPGAEPKASFRRGAGGAIVLQVVYSGTQLPDLTNILPQRSPRATILALTPGRATTLAELGSTEILGNTHYFRQDVKFRLPDDWLLLASQKAEFTLHYGFSADLAQGALLLVKVNGETIRLLPLDRDGGKVLPPLAMTFRANTLNPGPNTLTFEMSVPGDPQDLPCTPRKTDMLVILGDSSLTVPPSPSMRQADISHSLAQLGGDDIMIPPEIADPVRDEPTLIAFGARFPPLMTQGDRTRLHIVGVDSAGLVPRGNTDVTRRMLQTAVFPLVQTALPQPVAAPSGVSTSFSLADDNGLPALAAPQTVAPGGSIWSGFDHLWSAEGLIAAAAGTIRDLAFPGSTSLAKWLDGKSGLALVLQLDPTQPDDLWLIAGPDITMNDLATQLDLFRRAGHNGLHGQAALLQRDGTWVSWSANRRPELLEPLSLSNLRPVLGNYASWSPSLFTLLTLAFALLSVIPALVFVLITRRKGSRI
ncbi:MAG: cellulose biosynthesis cyclic di-GMP-binding regulatory protein BcsB [Cypionkella sp.]